MIYRYMLSCSTRVGSLRVYKQYCRSIHPPVSQHTHTKHPVSAFKWLELCRAAAASSDFGAERGLVRNHASGRRCVLQAAIQVTTAHMSRVHLMQPHRCRNGGLKQSSRYWLRIGWHPAVTCTDPKAHRLLHPTYKSLRWRRWRYLMRLVSENSLKIAQETRDSKTSGRLSFCLFPPPSKNCPGFLGYPLLPARFMQLVQRCSKA